MRDRLHDGSGGIRRLPRPTCRRPTPAVSGRTPASIRRRTRRRRDASSINRVPSSPVVTPDGGVLDGVYTRYNYARGHMFCFDASGNFMAAYDFGWNSTPAIHAHDGTYSIVIKDNHYDAGAYCNSDPSSAVSQLVLRHTTEGSVLHDASEPGHAGRMAVQEHDHRWNARERLRVVHQRTSCRFARSSVCKQRGWEPVRDCPGRDAALYTFLNQAIRGRRYTPLSLGPDGTIYTENDGILFAVGK